MLLGKNIVKGATQVSGHSFNLHFCMFERSQVKHNSLNCHNELLECFQLIVKFTYMLKASHESIFFCMFKTLKPWEWIVPVFSKCPFFLLSVYHSFWKLERILTLMIKRAKGFELMIFFYNQFEHIWFWPWKLWTLKMCFQQNLFIFIW